MHPTIQLIELNGLARHLVNDGLLDTVLAQQTIQQASQACLPLVSYLVQQHILSSEAIFQSCAKSFSLPTIDTYPNKLANDPIALNPQLIRHHHAYPLQLVGSDLYLAIADPSNHAALETISFHTGWNIKPVLIPEDKLNSLIDEYCNKNSIHQQFQLTLQRQDISEDEMAVHDNTVNYDEPIIKLVNSVIQHAIQLSASDIHIEPYATSYRIRHRQDGMLCNTAEIQHHLACRVITRLKVMAKLDITERRLPQDGRIQLIQDNKHTIDLRLSTCPTLLGEKVVLRILNLNHINLDINNLGFTDRQKNLFLTKISQPQGLILVTGPTGSGKTITLYSALQRLNTVEKNISTVEDPVEIQLPGLNQIHVHAKIGLGFATVLRALLRQDPDIIMIGEIRDNETASIAIQAAQTGHLVLSTVHANNAIETIIRLQSMGIAPHNLISAITLIIAQRLVRKLCAYCKKPTTNEPLSFHPQGCSHCRQGYQGRIALFELLPMTDKITHLLLSQTSPTSIFRDAKQEGFECMQDIASEKVKQGVTSTSEINRVVGNPLCNPYIP
ncbi:MAG: hypothetical protein A3E84_02455 [Gammaproteobacteria bacterium RIFCSPHIGHO2_12_FULL_42_13]|nr:MAG: hypothetical protein A3E84_02455 [Gammaproteobacteria bacterium RIFCSPHIGHO2_12_FULL_42_13]